MKSMRGITRAKLPSCTEILESEKSVVSAIEKKVIEIPLMSMAMKNSGLFPPEMNSMSANVIVRRRAITAMKISWAKK